MEFSENYLPIIDIVRFEVNILYRRRMLRLYATIFFLEKKWDAYDFMLYIK